MGGVANFLLEKQDKRKCQNVNADKGFNNFLACIEGLEYFNDPSKRKAILRSMS